MYNFTYRNNEVFLGPLNRETELGMSVKSFLDYSTVLRTNEKKHATGTAGGAVAGGTASSRRVGADGSTGVASSPSAHGAGAVNVWGGRFGERQPPALDLSASSLNEFIVSPTRMHYFDNARHLGFAAGPYASKLVVQNVERLVLHPDIGYYVKSMLTPQRGRSGPGSSPDPHDSSTAAAAADTTAGPVALLERTAAATPSSLLQPPPRKHVKVFTFTPEDNEDATKTAAEEEVEAEMATEAEATSKASGDDDSDDDVGEDGSDIGDANDSVAPTARGESSPQPNTPRSVGFAAALSAPVPNRLGHSDYLRKHSPQDSLAKVLNYPIFNGNNTKTILQSSKSERYYQLTYPLENCGRMYVLTAPLLPLYSVLLPWSHVCRLFEINPVKPPREFVVPVRLTRWAHLAAEYHVNYVIMFTPSLSMINRRDPVIQEGSVENVSFIFTYDTCDADIQLNNPYGCYNKHEDYDGDTNTHGIGKGVESHVEVNFNMKRQMLPLLRVRSVVPQNLLVRALSYFVRGVRLDDDDDDDDADVEDRLAPAGEPPRRRHLAAVLGEDGICRAMRDVYRHYSVVRASVWTAADHHLGSTGPAGTPPRSSVTHHRTVKGEELELLFALELLRRAVLVFQRLTDVSDAADRARATRAEDRLFSRRLHGQVFRRFLTQRAAQIRRAVREIVTSGELADLAIANSHGSRWPDGRLFARRRHRRPRAPLAVALAARTPIDPATQPLVTLDDDWPLVHLDDARYTEFLSECLGSCKAALHEIHRTWSPVSVSSVSNSQTMLDDVTRVIYCVFGEHECTRVLDHMAYVAHQDFPFITMGNDAYSHEYLVNILSRAKGDFDSLLRIQVSLHERLTRERADRWLEETRTVPLPLCDRDLLRPWNEDQIQHQIDYADKYVLGSKKIPKSCKQANSMKWALQNVQYFDGDLWINEALVVPDVLRYFSMEMFADTQLVDAVLNAELRGGDDATTAAAAPPAPPGF